MNNAGGFVNASARPFQGIPQKFIQPSNRLANRRVPAKAVSG
jgi:hypothetical protein